MITPQCLHKDDKIGIVSPAKFITPEKIENAVNIIEQLGYKVEVGENALARNHYFAGTDAQRTDDFQQMLDNPEIKMILCSRGGYGSVRIIDDLDFLKFKQNPKWIAGYSDITVFHSHLINLGFESLHSTMPLDFSDDPKFTEPVRGLFAIASGKNPDYNIKSSKLNKPGKTSGKIVGGNLSIICSLLGSVSDIDTKDKMLFIEEVGEDLYRLDRMMQSLLRAGKLDELAGLIVGGLTSMNSGNPDFGNNAKEIVLDAVKHFKYPVAFDFPAGHFPQNFPLVIGREMKLKVGEEVSLRSVEG